MSSPTERLQAVVQEHTALKALAASLKKQLNKAENKTKSVEAAAKKVKLPTEKIKNYIHKKKNVSASRV